MRPDTYYASDNQSGACDALVFERFSSRAFLAFSSDTLLARADISRVDA
jgi:hypothetical protein